MLKKIASLLFLVVSLICLSSAAINYDDDPLLNEISAKIDSYQVLKQVNYTPPFHWAEQLGLYKSNIRLNFFGNPIFAELRAGDISAVFDNDMFSTGWILTCLLEASLYGKGAPVIDKSRLQLALEAIGQFNDKNDPNYEHSLLRTFWPQIYNSTYNIWQQQPNNIRQVVLNANKFVWSRLENVFKFLRLEKFYEFCEKLDRLGQSAVDVFSIPPDFDDTYLNLGLGGVLFKLKDAYPKSYETWMRNNTDVQHLIDVTLKYSYRPFDSSTTSKNTIDPRTYYYARNFIQQAEANGEDLSLITTWIQSLDEQKELKNKSISMPFNINNVDVTVASNAVFGIASGSIYNVNGFGELFLKNLDMQQIFLNSTKFIAWAINTNLSSRPDLAQVYYPSTYNFLWYASRTLFLINNERKNFEFYLRNDEKQPQKQQHKLEFVQRFKRLLPILEEAKSYLEPAFQISATNRLFEQVRSENIDQNQQEMSCYFCDFLGQNDSNLFGKQHQSNDDCLFSTAQAINILISTWTYQDPATRELIFNDATPARVKSLLNASVKWLRANIFNKNLKKLNAFFSGSEKGFTTFPFYYPVNYLRYLNGSKADEQHFSRNDFGSLVGAVKGCIDERAYETELAKLHFGHKTPLVFPGYNEFAFAFWSSEPYTYAVALLALAQYNNIIL